MYDDGRPFVYRAWLFFQELKKKSYPSAASVAKLAGCSAKTMTRVIDELQNTFQFPIKYDQYNHGWVLQDPAFDFPTLPPTKEEYTALVLSKSLAAILGDKDLNRNIDTLWQKFSKEYCDTAVELETVNQFFSSELTAVADVNEKYSLMDFIQHTSARHGLEVHYKSPWKDGTGSTYRGRFLRVHFCDGLVYLLFGCDSGKLLVFNSACVLNMQHLGYDPLENVQLQNPPEDWLHGFGIWSGSELRDVELRIAAPAANYYAKQQWDETQADTWDGTTLIRKMKAQVSPEIVRRVLSLGSAVIHIEPAELRDAVRIEVAKLSEALS